MSDELDKKSQSSIVIVKSKHRFKFLSKLKNKIPHVNKKLAILLLIVLSIPITVGIALVQQEIRSRADQGNRKIFLGMATKTSHREATMQNVQADLERIKNETGAYPAVYHFFNNLGYESIPSLEILNYVDSKGITPMISLLPVGGEMERRDGRFIFSSSIDLPTGAFPTGQLKFDSQNPSAVTKIYVSKTASGTEAVETLVNTWIPGAKISVYGSKDNQTVDYDNSNHFDFTINSKTDKGDYWEIGVNVSRQGILSGIFTDSKPVFITMSDIFGKKWGNGEIANGSLDEKFIDFSNKAKEFGKPIILRYAWEMNGDWFPWSAGRRNQRISYGRYRYFDMGNTMNNYVSAWKHIYNLVKVTNSATNVKFNWCGAGYPGGYREYFPGDNYVDYVGFDAYSGINASQHGSLIDHSSGLINALRGLSSKKIIIGETGINTARKQISEDQFPAYRKNWLKEGYTALYNSPKVAGIIYFNLDARFAEAANNWLMSDNPEISSAYRELLLDPRFQGKFGQQAPPVTPTPSPTPNPTGNPTPTPTPNPTTAPPPPDPTGCVRKLPTISYGDTTKSGKRKDTVIYRITIKNNDSGCNERKIALDLNIPANLPRWSYLPESVKLNPNETKTVDFKVTSGEYANPGVKSLNLSIRGAYKPHKVFSSRVLQYNVVE